MLGLTKWDYKSSPHPLEDAAQILTFLDNHQGVGRMWGRTQHSAHTAERLFSPLHEPGSVDNIAFRFTGKGTQFIQIEPAPDWSCQRLDAELRRLLQELAEMTRGFIFDRRARNRDRRANEETLTNLVWLLRLAPTIRITSELPVTFLLHDLMAAIAEDGRDQAFSIVRQINALIEDVHRKKVEAEHQFVKADDERKRLEAGFVRAAELISTGALGLNGRTELVNGLVTAFRGGDPATIEQQLHLLAGALNHPGPSKRRKR